METRKRATGEWDNSDKASSGEPLEPGLDGYGHMTIIKARDAGMPRPYCCRLIAGEPSAIVFRPTGRRVCELERIDMTLDELEALRLADFQGQYQEQAAAHMGVSRTTFGRIAASAHRKVAEALVLGKVLHIQGGPVSCGPSPSGHCSKRSQGRCRRSR
jgi:predicted DNA-binding protein (UPF0251 family)